jgi:hypothetical protein
LIIHHHYLQLVWPFRSLPFYCIDAHGTAVAAEDELEVSNDGLGRHFDKECGGVLDERRRRKKNNDKCLENADPARWWVVTERVLRWRGCLGGWVVWWVIPTQPSGWLAGLSLGWLAGCQPCIMEPADVLKKILKIIELIPNVVYTWDKFVT